MSHPLLWTAKFRGQIHWYHKAVLICLQFNFLTGSFFPFRSKLFYMLNVAGCFESPYKELSFCPAFLNSSNLRSVNTICFFKIVLCTPQGYPYPAHLRLHFQFCFSLSEWEMAAIFSVVCETVILMCLSHPGASPPSIPYCSLTVVPENFGSRYHAPVEDVIYPRIFWLSSVPKYSSPCTHHLLSESLLFCPAKKELRCSCLKFP